MKSSPLKVIPIIAVMLLASCSSGSSGGGGGGTGIAPVLENLVVAFAAYDSQTGRAGDFVFVTARNKVFDEFGAVVEGAEGEPVVLPTFEYKVAPDAQLLSPMAGIISQVDYQEETSDYSVVIIPESDSEWFVNIDHVIQVAVAVGESVTAGQLLGKPGVWDDTLGRTELMVVKNQTYYCPFNLFAPALKSAYEAKVTQLMNEWETFKGDDTIYDQAAMVVPGCNESTLTD
jgi:hypothetical protein